MSGLNTKRAELDTSNGRNPGKYWSLILGSLAAYVLVLAVVKTGVWIPFYVRSLASDIMVAEDGYLTPPLIEIEDGHLVSLELPDAKIGRSLSVERRPSKVAARTVRPPG